MEWIGEIAARAGNKSTRGEVIQSRHDMEPMAVSGWETMMRRTESGVHVRAIARFDDVSIWFHWTTLLLIVAMFATAFARERAGDGDSAAFLLTLHRSLGILLWLITLARLGWKALAGRSPPLPPSISRVQRYAARMTEYGLFLLLMVQPVTG